MTAAFDEESLRHWLVDYLVTNIGCSPDDIDIDAAVNDLGVGSRDAVVLCGELSELLSRPVSPVELWEHPSIGELTRFLSGSAPEPDAIPTRDAHQHGTDEPIAVIGLGCRFPGAGTGPEAFWEFLCRGGSAVEQVPGDRWAPFDDGSPETAAILARTTRWGSFLADIDAFDAEFFDISAREATKMDPQQRLLLEVAWEALEHAGIPASSLRRSQTGVFAGACYTDYGYLASLDLAGVDAWSNPGGALSIIANRLSYLLDLRGPSVTVDTACSSSLVALHLACQSLRAGDSDLALAAGVNLLLSPAVFRAFDQTGALSASGACHAFDADADGFVRGEGCGVAVLKRLSDARRDGDRLLAVIRGSAVNSDGRSNGMLAPNPAAQMAVLRAAYSNAGVQPQDVDYVETHGTGTLLGDPIEARALGTVLGRGRQQESPLLIGAVKSNLGHLEAAAGIAGFIKAVLAVQHGSIPKNLHFQTPNPHIAFDQMRLRVVTEQQDFPVLHRPRRAGVSAFGFGGTNVHVVIEQAPEYQPAVRQPASAVTTLVVSGDTTERIGSLAGMLAEWMDGAGSEVNLPDVAHTLNHHRAVHSRFATVCARDRSHAVAGLQALADGRSADGVVGPHDGSCGPGIVFVYSGQGSHWAGMGRQLLTDEPAFATALARLEPVFAEQVGFSLWQVIAGGEPVSGDAQVQPVLMGLQLALTELWRSYGVHPDAVIGHSMGEVTAAVVAGALSPADGLKVIATRSQLMSRLAGQGAVALLNLDAETTEALIADFSGLSVAGYLSPRQTVIAGPVDPVEAAIATVSAQNRFARRVNMEVASHTALMDPILPDLRAALAGLEPEVPIIPFLSTVAGGAEAGPALHADYWADNVRQPARFSQAISAAGREYTTFIEVSAHPILTHAISDTLEPSTHHHSIGTLWRDGDDTVSFHTNVNRTHTSHPPHTPHLPEPHPMLPTTPWKHTRFWADVAPIRRRGGSQVSADRVADTGIVPAEWWYEEGWPVRESPVAPADPDVSGGSWLVIADDGLGTEMRRTFGDAVRVLSPSTLDHPDPVLAEAIGGVTDVLYAPPTAAAGFTATPGYRLFNAARRLAAAAVEQAETASPPRVFLLTRNGQAVSDGERTDPSHAVLWGLGRTLALEHPEIWGGIIDVDQSVPDGLVTKYVVAEAYPGDGEDQVAYRSGVRRVPRLQPGYPSSASPMTLNTETATSTCHLVVGATGNVGPHLIRQLSDMGAETIVAVSRNPGSRLDELAASLSSAGTSLVTVAADASDENAMTALFDRFGADLPALGGVYLAAFGGAPVTLRDMTEDDVTAMFRPKLDAVALLHRLSLPHPVSQFVLFTSISGLTGSRWLAHYAATTTFLDAFAYARRTAGLPATAINWGLWKSLTDSQSEAERQITLDSGLEPMPDEIAIQALPWMIGAGDPVRCTIVAADWGRLATAYRTRAALHIVDDLLSPEEDADRTTTPKTTQFRTRLRDCDPARRRDLLAEHVTAEVVAAMGLASAQLLDPAVGFFQSGMDSLMSVTLQRSLSESLGEVLPAAVVFDYPTVEALTGYLATILPELVEVAEQENTDAYDALTDDELLQQLSERLG